MKVTVNVGSLIGGSISFPYRFRSTRKGNHLTFSPQGTNTPWGCWLYTRFTKVFSLKKYDTIIFALITNMFHVLCSLLDYCWAFIRLLHVFLVQFWFIKEHILVFCIILYRRYILTGVSLVVLKKLFSCFPVW